MDTYIKTGVSISALSWRWRYLWTQITYVTINNHQLRGTPNFYFAVDHFLIQLTSPLVRYFSLVLDSPFIFPTIIVDSWFNNICGRNVEVIEVTVHKRRRLRFNPPPCIFQTPSLVQLQLLNPHDYAFPNDVEVNLPNLKLLSLTRIVVTSKTLMLSLLPLISDVEELSLSSSALCALMGLKEDKSEGCSMFGKLSWSSVNSLLTNVKRIKIEVCQLRSEPKLLKLVKDLLSSAGSLEVFSLYVNTTSSEIDSNKSEERWELMFYEALYRIPMSSNECKIEFFGRFHRESGRGSVTQICSSDQFISAEQKVQVQSAAPTVSPSSSC